MESTSKIIKPQLFVSDLDINQGNKREVKQKEKILWCFLLQLNFFQTIEILVVRVVESLIDPKDYGTIFLLKERRVQEDEKINVVTKQ